MKCVNCKQTAENMKEAKSVLDPPSGWADLMWKLGAYRFLIGMVSPVMQKHVN